MAGIPVDKEVFEELKAAYSEKFGASPTSLMNKLNRAYKEELENPGDNLIAERTLRGFFNSSSPPNTHEKNLNYLCYVLLNYRSYQEALRQIKDQVNVDIDKLDIEGDWLDPYWKHLEKKCNHMKILDMDKPINIDSIYVRFKILTNVQRRKQKTIENLLNDLGSENNLHFKRLSFYRNESQISALEAVRKYAKLMILGKPGAGKTTFLKYLAMHSYVLDVEESIRKLVPIFIQLRELVDNGEKINLVDAIIHEFTNYLPNHEKTIRKFLEKGKCLILLDALDEVEIKGREIYKEIDNLTSKFPDNHFVITRRHRGGDYVFKNFPEVEAADFDEEQIEKFVYNWFAVETQNSNISRSFLEKLNKRKSAKELATNPLLLTILCLTFNDNYDFSRNRYALYADAVDSLLRRWDATRRIDRKKHFQLPRQRQIAMFSQIAYA